MLLVGLYLCVTGIPIFRGGIGPDSMSISWSFLASSSIITLILVGAWALYKRERQRVIASIENDWKAYVDKITSLHHQSDTDEHYGCQANARIFIIS